MTELSVIEVPPGATLEAEREILAHGNLFVACDRRRDYLIYAQRVCLIRDFINDELNEPVKLSSLYNAAARGIRRGYHYSFMMEKMPVEELKSFSESMGHRYRKVVVAAAQPGAWKVSPPVVSVT